MRSVKKGEAVIKCEEWEIFERKKIALRKKKIIYRI